MKIANVSSQDISWLAQQKFDIVKVDVRRNVYAYVTSAEQHRLIAAGFEIAIEPDVSRQYADSLWLATKNSANPMDAYHTFDELTAELQLLAQQYPNLCQLQSIGKSVLGRDLWFVKISDHVAAEEVEPEFKYISSMHGDEPVGMELCLYFMRHLLENYGQDSRITFLVDETEIWIMPLMNPDGYIARRRWNQNGIDLNRNFPDRIDDPNNSIVGRQLETQAVMNFGFNHSFVLSANFHTGVVVVNYPYDSNSTGLPVYTVCPDDELFVTLAKAYSIHNAPMWSSLDFQYGITNGADWYVIYGGMQDWNYIYCGANEVTIELSDVSWPAASLLPTFWEDNRESMLAYLEAVHWGVRGVISDSLTGLPIAATIEVVGNEHAVYSDPDMGDYYRMLLPGVYSLRFLADGYHARQVDSVIVSAGKTTRLDVRLAPTDSYNITGTVAHSISGAPVAANLQFTGPGRFSAATQMDGSFQLLVPAGHYAVKITSNEFMSETDSIAVFENRSLHYNMSPAEFLFRADFETGNGNFTAGDMLWQWGKPGVGPAQANSGGNVWATCLSRTYPDSADGSLYAPAFDVPPAKRIELTFYSWMEAETDADDPSFAYDGGIVEWRPDTTSAWMQLSPVDGYPFAIPDGIESGPFAPGTGIFSGSHPWQSEVFDLASCAATRLHLRFRFGSDGDNAAPLAGWYLDDVAIKYIKIESGVSREAIDNQGAGFSLSQNVPNPFNNSTTVSFSVQQPGVMRITIFNARGQLIRTLMNERVESGNFKIDWDGSDALGESLTSGVYFIRAASNGDVLTRKIVLMK
ncbi:MAG: M14 family zinc carboxypeptidase [Candidatus Zhuqueibacterota bacterium]